MDIKFVFWGTPDIAVASLEALETHGLLPRLIVTAPDRKVGRGLELTPTDVKVWANERNIPVLSPEKLSDHTFMEALSPTSYSISEWDVFVVVAYGKILPHTILSLPRLGTINMHPSLLPRHRGPAPVESQILFEGTKDGVGISIILLDKEMDHGPILAHASVGGALLSWPIGAVELRALLGEAGGTLLSTTLPEFVQGNITPIPQDHTQATFCKKIEKEAGLITLTDDPFTNFKKICAYEIWPRAYFFAEKHGKQIRVVITKASYENNILTIESVIPEGRKEMTWDEFQRYLVS
ncbi:MAG: methionyl-tRNA formyltransferase [Patescibacteria group bacterium]